MFKPVKVEKVETVCGGDMKKLLPPKNEIPDDFMDLGTNNKWTKAFTDWFYSGITDVQVAPKDSVDVELAMNHLKAIMSSHEPSAELKQGSVAYLLSIWFHDFKYQSVRGAHQ